MKHENPLLKNKYSENSWFFITKLCWEQQKLKGETMEIVLAAAFIAIICISLYFYGKFLAFMIVKKAKKSIEQGKLNDKTLIREHKKCDTLALTFLFIGGPLIYFQMKKAYVEIKDIYGKEIQKRNLN